MFRGSVKVIHFVGIGGIGMSGIAEVLLTLGFSVTGSDLKAGDTVQRLRTLGAVVHEGHAADNVGSADVVVRSTAVGPDNVEVAEALRRGVPVIRRAEMLAELMRLKYGIAVAGTHGKTTTTSMLATVLAAGGIDPTIVIGGRLDSLGGTNARLGAGDYLVAEADESDGTFNELAPTVTIVTNIDPEHLDHHGSVDNLEAEFVRFANRVPFYGFSVLCLDHPRVQKLIPQIRRRVVTYGYARHADVRASQPRSDGLSTRFGVSRGSERLGEIELHMPGLHNVANATAAVATALELAIPFDTIASALQGFTGVQRRFTVVGERDGAVLVDDYAHHPVEIEATLQAAVSAFPDRRIVAVFQPHRFSRVRDLWSEFCMAFNQADEVLVCPVYAAGEKPLEGIDQHTLCAELRDRGHRGSHALGSLDEAVDWVRQHGRSDDLVVSLGAGNVNSVVQRLASGA
jgi:UDP-N-acetylmuramate--alanine ligase